MTALTIEAFEKMVDQAVERELDKARAAIIRLRANGRFETANKMSEYLHWAERDYEADWLPGLLRGFPADPAPANEAMAYAPVVERMIEILGAKDCRISFGEALDQAARQVGLVVPLHMEAPLLLTAFQVISMGRIPGLPDA